MIGLKDMLIENQDKQMIDGVAELIRMVKDMDNRKQMADAMLKKFDREGVKGTNKEKFYKMCKL